SESGGRAALSAGGASLNSSVESHLKSSTSAFEEATFRTNPTNRVEFGPVARVEEAASSRDDSARGMRCTSRVDHAGKFSGISLERGPSTRNGGHQSKEHDEAVPEHGSELNSDDEDFLDPKSTRFMDDATINRHGEEESTYKNWAAEPEAGGAVRRRELRAETAQFLPCGASPSPGGLWAKKGNRTCRAEPVKKMESRGKRGRKKPLVRRPEIKFDDSLE
ncbi:hypothetical protein THAOC_32436, partial [Thalassiosira oceanica]